MARAKTNFSVKTIVDLISLIVAVGTCGYIFLENYAKGETPTASDLFWVVISLYFVSLIIDRASTLATDWFADGQATKESEQRRATDASILDAIAKLPGGLAGNSVFAFPNISQAIQYGTKLCPGARSVKNTVLRYNLGESYPLNDPLYQAWWKVKCQSLKERQCDWTEIISSKLASDDIQISLLREASENHYRYRAEQLDETKHEMLQMIIFQFDTYKEAIFGWEFHANTGKCFVTRNSDLISYLEDYFQHYFGVAAAERQRVESMNTVPVTSEHRLQS